MRVIIIRGTLFFLSYVGVDGLSFPHPVFPL